jgi:hypothetical protein
MVPKLPGHTESFGGPIHFLVGFKQLVSMWIIISLEIFKMNRQRKRRPIGRLFYFTLIL